MIGTVTPNITTINAIIDTLEIKAFLRFAFKYLCAIKNENLIFHSAILNMNSQ